MLSHRIRIILYLINHWSDLDIVFTYAVTDKSSSSDFIEQSFVTPISVRNSFLSYSLEPRSYSVLRTYRWLVQTVPGFHLEFPYCDVNGVVGYLSVYDGPEDAILITKLTCDSNGKIYGNIVTEYFQSLLVLRFTDVQPAMLVEFFIHFVRQNQEYNSLPLNSLTTLNHTNQHGALNHVYELRESRGDYPRVRFTVRKFTGLNWGGCSFGGFIIRQKSISHPNSLQDFGPFCHDSSLRYLLVFHCLSIWCIVSATDIFSYKVPDIHTL